MIVQIQHKHRSCIDFSKVLALHLIPARDSELQLIQVSFVGGSYDMLYYPSAEEAGAAYVRLCEAWNNGFEE